MSFLLHDSLSDIESTELTTSRGLNLDKTSASASPKITIIEEKFRLPAVGPILSRARLLELLNRSIGQYGATLVSGRAGTGKTTLAAEFAGNQEKASWCTIEPADADWRDVQQATAKLLDIRLGTERVCRFRALVVRVCTSGPSASKTAAHRIRQCASSFRRRLVFRFFQTVGDLARRKCAFADAMPQ